MSRDEEAVIDILIAARRTKEALEGLSRDEFLGDWEKQSAVEHQLMIIGEAVKRLSQDFRGKYDHMPWKRMAGHRNILIHQYNNVDLEQVWEIATKEIPPLISFLESIAPEPEENDNE
jgi:uncharacterized protein with HEPN domain